MPYRKRKAAQQLFRDHAGWKIGRWLYTQLRNRPRSVGTQTLTKRKQISSGRGITHEYDRKLIYKKKRMPRKKRKRWLKFSKKVKAVSEKSLGARTVVYNTSVEFDNSTANNQVVGGVGLYTGYRAGVGNEYLSDLYETYDNENQGNPTAADGETTDLTSKFMFQSAVLDLTIRNISHAGGTPSILRDTIELDIYELTASKLFTDTAAGQYTSLKDLFDQAGSDMKQIGASATGTQIGKRGCTPWDVTEALSQGGLKIYKKTKYFLGSGQTMTYQMRDPRRHVVHGQGMKEMEGINHPKLTKWILILAKVVPGITVGTTGSDTHEKIVVGLTRKYFYKIEGMNDARHAYFNQ